MTVPNAAKQSTLPGKPKLKEAYQGNLTLFGNGVWESYFHPVPNASKATLLSDDPSCTRLPVVQMTDDMVFPGMHYNAPWAVRAWVYHPPMAPKEQTLNQWFGDMRQRGAHVVQRYFTPLPALVAEINRANPLPLRGQLSCLALHVRYSDKASGRQRIAMSLFEEYAKAYLDAGGGTMLYVAMDDASVIQNITALWPKRLNAARLKVRSLTGAFRTDSNEAIFNLAPHHRANQEALVEVYAMARCNCLLHGDSAMSEAAHYLNYPQLHRCSVNLDQRDRPSVDQFADMVRASSK